MSQRFIRCPHCRLPHLESEQVCPLTGQAIEIKRTWGEGNSLPPPPGSAPPGSLPPPGAASAPPGSASPGSKLPSSRPPPPISSHPPIAFRDAVQIPRGLLGSVIDDAYLVKGLIGRGGMAMVYEGEHVKLGRPVALKMLPLDRTSNTEARRRFLQEARAAASLSHPNICAIYDFGTLPDDTLYCAMERLFGETLSSRLDEDGALSVHESIDTIVQVLAGLGEAHKKSIIHRDIKPENVFLSTQPSGRQLVKLLDFGLVKHLTAGDDDEDEATQLTHAGMVVGTPAYMAPEQALGDRDLDARVDLWAAGVVLYECLTGKAPFRGHTWGETVHSLTQNEPIPLTQARPAAAAALGPVLQRALRKDRALRYASAGEFQADLLRARGQVRSGV